MQGKKNIAFPFFSIIAFIAIIACPKSSYAYNGDSCTFYFTKAKEAREARKVWETEQYLKKSISFNPNNTSVLFELANFYSEGRKYFLAHKIYAGILLKEPANTTAIQYVIETAFLLRKWEELINYATQASNLQINIDKINFKVGKAHYELEDYGKARRALLLQKQNTPTHVETLQLLTQIHVTNNNFEEAIIGYLECLKLLPNDASLLYELGIVYSNLDKNEEAIKYFELAASKGLKQDLAYLENLGTCYLYVDLNKGVEILKKVIEKKPDDEECLMQIAKAYFRVNKFNDAHLAFFKIYENNKSNTKALYMSGLALIRKEDKDRDRGIAICELAISLNPELEKQKTVISKF